MYKDYICLDTCKHMKDTCYTPDNCSEVLSTQKYHQFDSSHTSDGHSFKSYANFLIHTFFWDTLYIKSGQKKMMLLAEAQAFKATMLAGVLAT